MLSLTVVYLCVCQQISEKRVIEHKLKVTCGDFALIFFITRLLLHSAPPPTKIVNAKAKQSPLSSDVSRVPVVESCFHDLYKLLMYTYVGEGRREEQPRIRASGLHLNLLIIYFSISPIVGTFWVMVM